MEQDVQLSKFGFKHHREMYERFLSAAKSMLLEEQVSEADRCLVRTLVGNDDWINKHSVSPYDFSCFEVGENYESEGDNIEGEDAESGLTKEMLEFGVKERSLNEGVFVLAKKIWDCEPFVDACRGCSDFTAAIDMVVRSKFSSIDDFSRLTQALIKEVAVAVGDDQTMKILRWRLADCHYILGQYGEALSLYEKLLSSEMGYIARPALACQIINIKSKMGTRIAAKDLMALVKPSAFKFTIGEYAQQVGVSSNFLDLALDGMVTHGLSLDEVFEEASRETKPYECFYRSSSIQAFLKENLIDYSFRNLSPDSQSLNNILSYLFGEMRFLRQQLKEVAGIQDDWEMETELYNRLRDVFPNEKIIHHYRAPWLWKYQLTIYFPELNFAIDYRGHRVMNAENYTRQSGGMAEYIRLYDRTIKKAKNKYGIHVKEVNKDTPFDEIVSTIRNLERNG